MGFSFMLWAFFLAGGTWLNPIPMLIASIFPDSDHRNAPMGRIIPLWLFFRHRGFTHTIWTLIITSSIMWGIFSLSAALSWFIGYLSHMILDACTPSGIKWFGQRKRRLF